MAVEAIECRVVAVTRVGGVALDALAAVSARYGCVETLSCAVPPDALLFIHLRLQIDGNAVHP